MDAPKSSLRAAGELDLTFAEQGIRNLFFPVPEDSPVSRLPVSRSLQSSGMSVAVSPIGSVVVSATVKDSSGRFYGLAKLLVNGNLDVSFGSGGYVSGRFLADKPSMGGAVGLYEQGEILLSGIVEQESGKYSPVIARFLPDGTPDPDFGVRGVVLVPSFVPEFAGASLGHVWFSPTTIKNKIVYAIATGGIGLICRFNSNGSLDTSFDGKGWTIVRLPGTAITLAGVIEHESGRIVVYGQALGSTQDGILFAYDKDGKPDVEFGLSGIQRLSIKQEDQRFNSRLTQVVIKLDGSLVAVGAAIGEKVEYPLMVGLTSAGHIDTRFNGGVPVLTDSGSDPALSYWSSSVVSHSTTAPSIFNVGITHHPDIRLLVGGFSSTGQINPDFGDGKGWTASVSLQSTDVSLQPDDRMVVVGTKGSVAQVIRLLTRS